MGDLDARHLEAAVSAKNKRPKSRADLAAQGSRNRKTHRRIETLRQIEAIVSDLDIDPAKEGIPRLRDNHKFLAACEKMVYLTQHVGHAHAAIQVRPRLRDIVVIDDFFSMRL